MSNWGSAKSGSSVSESQSDSSGSVSWKNPFLSGDACFDGSRQYYLVEFEGITNSVHCDCAAFFSNTVFRVAYTGHIGTVCIWDLGSIVSDPCACGGISPMGFSLRLLFDWSSGTSQVEAEVDFGGGQTNIGTPAYNMVPPMQGTWPLYLATYCLVTTSATVTIRS